MTAAELLEYRWQVIATDVQQFANERDISAVNSKLIRRLDDTLTTIVARMVDDGIHGDESDELLGFIDRLHGIVHDEVLTWAESIETARLERRRAVR